MRVSVCLFCWCLRCYVFLFCWCVCLFLLVCACFVCLFCWCVRVCFVDVRVCVLVLSVFVCLCVSLIVCCCLFLFQCIFRVSRNYPTFLRGSLELNERHTQNTLLERSLILSISSRTKGLPRIPPCSSHPGEFRGRPWKQAPFSTRPR